VESLLLFFTQWMVRALALVAVAGVASLAMRKAGAAVRHAVWIAAAAGMLMLPVLQLTAPELRVPVWIERAAPASAADIEPLPMELPEVAVSTPVQLQPPPKPVDYGAILLAVYLAGVAILLARQAASPVKLRRLVRAAAAMEPDSLAEAAQAIGYAGKLPGVKESRAVRVPFTCGAGEPVIILPADWREWPSMKLFAVLAHETAHVARRDWLTARLAAVNKAVNWWNPAAWWLERHLAAEAEEAVDEMALAAVGDVKQYASAVVDFAIAMQGARLGSMEATAMARSTKVWRRVERILASNAAGARSLRRGTILMIAAAAMPLVVLAASALPEVRQVGPSEQLTPAIQTPGAPTVVHQTRAAQPVTEPVPQLEQMLAQNPDQISTRSKLMTQYIAEKEIEKAREQAWWIVENAPGSRDCSLASTLLLPGRPLFKDDSDSERLREIWRGHVRRYGTSATVLAQASQASLGFMDFFDAEDLLLRARMIEPENRGYLSQLALLYITVLEPTRAVNPNAPQVIAFRSKAVSELETTTDANLAGLAGEMLTAGHVIMAAGKTSEEEAALRARQKARNDLASKYLKRALSMDPENSRWRVALERASGEPQVVRMPEAAPGVKRITVGGNVQRARLKNEVRPEYPPLAKQARIQGSVRFSLIIATDGTVKNITLLSGHPLLVQPATEAVKQWVFEQTLLNGEPVEVVSEAEVRFEPLEPLAQAVLEGNAYRIGGGVTAPVPISRVQPVFPKGIAPEIQHAVVLLSIVIAKDGSVTNVEPLRGDPAFFENAIEAVKQWRFTPGMKEGEPVPVQARVEVNFRKL
jgi:TonB family protein